MWLLFLTLHVFGLSGYNLVLRKSLLANQDRWALATIMQTGVAIPMFVALFLYPPDLSIYSPKHYLLIVVIALLSISLHIFNVKALQHLETSIYTILYNLRIPFTTFLGVLFLKEHPAFLQVIGGLLIFLAVTLIRQNGTKSVNLIGIAWGIAAAISISLLNFYEKILIAAVGYLPYAIPVMILATLIMWSIMLVRRQHINTSVFTSTQGLSLMGLRALSAYGFSLALYAGGILSVSSYISSLSVIITVALGIFLLGEREYLFHKIAATIIAAAGLTAILIARL